MPLPDLRLKLLLPTEVLVDEAVTKIVAEAANGSFCLLPRHIDFVAALVPGILCFHTVAGGEQVFVSTRDAVRGTALDQLRATVAERFLALDEHERVARSALARLEAGTIRRFIELEEQSHA